MSIERPFAVGIDVGTSGCRASVLSPAGEQIAFARAALPEPLILGNGCVEQDAELWWSAVLDVLREAARALPRGASATLCVDGTSGTFLLADPRGQPLGPAAMYNDRRATAAAADLERVAPRDSPARDAGASLAKLLHFSQTLKPPPGSLALHQADWIGGRLAGRLGWSDWNNALKLGYDAERLIWPDWVSGLVPGNVRLPEVLAPGASVGPLEGTMARALGLAPGSRVAAGTTDSTAAVIAAGVREPGDAVTCLGSTLVLKVLSPRPIASPSHGVYSHRLGDLWLVGGASNSGGAVLRQRFDDSEIARLSATMDWERPSGLDYYPLPRTGERFPRNDPMLAPRIAPVPEDRQRLLQGLLEGIASIEAEGYRLLAALGAPAPRQVTTIGGGAANPAWTRLRERILGVPVTAAACREAAQGAALLALRGARLSP